MRHWVCAGQNSSRKPLGGLSKETEEIKVGNSHQNLPNQEKCRHEPSCEGTEGNRGRGAQHRFRLPTLTTHST
ncbi:hypothetical protein AMECASPLE_038701 [Ameca splendens]|uniref:Uncharacterized protein n=1 Tax=Ameca splendens TaxID=208324 RepID=A0ABV1AEM6_9TELE